MPDTSDIPVGREALVAAESAFGKSPAVGDWPQMVDAIQAAIRAMGFELRWSVPCLDKAECRTIYRTHEEAARHAKREGPNAVIESRLEQPWRLS